MKPFRVETTRRAIVVASLGVIGLLVGQRPLQAAGNAEALLRATPLVLKDGRIANVSIHVVPFAPGRADLAAEPETRLTELTHAVGTDCFLTAQVIGHIDSSEVAQDATLNAHRLARSRADAVQAALIGGGLPAKAIASVWDWQFMVREPRATLWVFQLTAGEDCEGRPLRGDLVAAAPPATGQEAPAEPQGRAIVSALAPAEPTPARTAARVPVAPGVDTALPPAEPTPARTAARAPVATAVDTAPPPAEPLPNRSWAEPVPARTGVPSVTRPLPGVDAETAAQARQAIAAPARQVAATPQPAAKPPTTDGKVERNPEGALVITFATNSSYFPSGAAARLRELFAGIDAESSYEVTLQVAVSGATHMVGARSAEEATRYNKWLAERRLERVQNWLAKNAAADALSIRPEYVANDDSRQVIVRVAPVG